MRESRKLSRESHALGPSAFRLTTARPEPSVFSLVCTSPCSQAKQLLNGRRISFARTAWAPRVYVGISFSLQAPAPPRTWVLLSAACMDRTGSISSFWRDYATKHPSVHPFTTLRRRQER